MKKIKIEVHPSVLLAILAMLAVIFFYSYKEAPEIVEVRIEQKRENPMEKTWDEIYARYPSFPEGDEGDTFMVDGEWWTFDKDIKEFVRYE